MAAKDDRQALLSLLKGQCGVSVLGHRHRIITLIMSTANDGTTSIGAPAATSVTLSTDAPRSSVDGSSGGGANLCNTVASALATPFVKSMVSTCEVFDGPLPFMTLKAMKTTGPRLQIALVRPPIALRQHHCSAHASSAPADRMLGGLFGISALQDYPGLHRVRAEPPIYLVENFLSEAECASLVRCADPLLIRSKTDSGVTDTRQARATLTHPHPPSPTLLSFEPKPQCYAHPRSQHITVYAPAQRHPAMPVSLAESASADCEAD
jgi:hypothetical protein